jgi:hypothetical protein
VDKLIAGLLSNTTYHYRVVGVNVVGITNGADQIFTTSSLIAAVTTQAVTGIGTTFATGNGNVIDLGAPDPTQHGVCWSTSENPTTADSKIEEGSVTATGTFTSGMTGLVANTVYYVKAYTTNAAGTSYGSQVSFTTSRNIGVIVSPLSSTITDEDGATASFTVVLNSQPSADVLIPLSSSDTSEGTVSPASLTFTSSNWATVQTVTVTGVNDDLLDDDIAYKVEIGPAVSSDSGYDGNSPAAKNLTNIDTDLDDDGDGISNEREGSGDRDDDGVPNFRDYDPSGYFYDSADGSIVSGGHIDVSGPGTVTFVSGRNGVSGYYQFIVNEPGTYTITVFPPSGYDVDSNCVELGTLAVTGNPNPYVLGSGENGSSGVLVDFDCVRNPWYLTIDIQVSTSLILNNNIPLHYNNSVIPTLNKWGMILSGCLLSLVALIVFRRREKV